MSNHSQVQLPYYVRGEAIQVDTSNASPINFNYRISAGNSYNPILGNLFKAANLGQIKSNFSTWYRNSTQEFAVAGTTTLGGSVPDYTLSTPGTYIVTYSYTGHLAVRDSSLTSNLFSHYYRLASSDQPIKIWIGLIGGGGGGGSGNAWEDPITSNGGGGGGGGGGVIIHPLQLNMGDIYTVIIGAGGKGSEEFKVDGEQGGSTFLKDSFSNQISVAYGGSGGKSTTLYSGGGGGNGGGALWSGGNLGLNFNYLTASGTSGGKGGSAAGIQWRGGGNGGSFETDQTNFYNDYKSLGVLKAIGGAGTLVKPEEGYVGGGGGGANIFPNCKASSDTVDGNNKVTRSTAVCGGGGHGGGGKMQDGGSKDPAKYGSNGGNGAFAIWCS